DILRFICNESQLSLKNLEIIWNALDRAARKTDDVDDELGTITKIIDDISSLLNSEHFEYLFKKFESLKVFELRLPHLQLMKELTKHTYKQNETEEMSSSKRVIDILWNIIQDNSDCDDEII